MAVLARLAGIRLRPSDTSSQATGKIVVAVPDQADALYALNRVYERVRYGPAERAGEGLGGLNLTATWERVRGTLVGLALRRPWRRK